MGEDYNFLSMFSQYQNVLSFPAGALLFKKGDRANAMYVVRSGKIEIFDGPITYEMVAAGDILGEMAMVDGGPRSASARAVTECQVIPVDDQRFRALVEKSPPFAIRVMRVMGKRLRSMNERLQAAIDSMQAKPPPS